MEKRKTKEDSHEEMFGVSGRKTAEKLRKKGVVSPLMNRTIRVNSKTIIGVPARIKTFAELLKWRRDIQFKYGS